MLAAILVGTEIVNTLGEFLENAFGEKGFIHPNLIQDITTSIENDLHVPAGNTKSMIASHLSNKENEEEDPDKKQEALIKATNNILDIVQKLQQANKIKANPQRHAQLEKLLEMFDNLLRSQSRQEAQHMHGQINLMLAAYNGPSLQHIDTDVDRTDQIQAEEKKQEVVDALDKQVTSLIDNLENETHDHVSDNLSTMSHHSDLDHEDEFVKVDSAESIKSEITKNQNADFIESLKKTADEIYRPARKAAAEITKELDTEAKKIVDETAKTATTVAEEVKSTTKTLKKTATQVVDKIDTDVKKAEKEAEKVAEKVAKGAIEEVKEDIQVLAPIPPAKKPFCMRFFGGLCGRKNSANKKIDQLRPGW